MKRLLASIKTKIQLSFLTFILLATVTGVLSYMILHTILDHEALKSKIDEMASNFTEARKQEKDFILYDRKEVAFLENGKCESLQQFARAISTIQQLIRQIKETEGVAKEDALYSKLNTLESAVLVYDRQFWGLVNAYKIRGFKDHGMEGDMREVIHQLQKCESKEEQWFALMLRRHEKDFFIRHDPAYVQALHKRAQDFIAFVEDAQLPHMSAAYKERTISAIRNYVDYFDRIAAIETRIGLTKKEGFIGALNKSAESTEPLLAQVQQLIHDRNQTLAENSTLLLLLSISLMVACGLAFNFLLARKISNPIIQLSQVVAQASVGDDTTLRTLEGMQRGDELGRLIVSIGHMFREITLKVEEISQKNLLLQATAQQEKERTWVTEGISLFDGLMVKHANDLYALCDEFLSNLVKYTQSSQAALLLPEVDQSGNTFMKIQSCYAGDKKRHASQRIAVGEGLVGAVWQEKESCYMTDIPESYSKIRSGLGQSNPTAVFIVPAMLEDGVEAIVEIASFREYSDREKDLIQQVCKGLANAISRVRIQEQTTILLERANALTEELRQNEEEMRQQLEELTANQEKYQGLS